MCERFSIFGWAGRLLSMSATFLASARNIWFKSLTHSPNKALSTQLFRWARYLHGNFLMFLKHLGFFALPMTNIGSFSPVALTAAKPVILILLCLPPQHFSDINRYDLSGKTEKTIQIHLRCRYLLDCSWLTVLVELFHSRQLTFRE